MPAKCSSGSNVYAETAALARGSARASVRIILNVCWELLDEAWNSPPASSHCQLYSRAFAARCHGPHSGRSWHSAPQPVVAVQHGILQANMGILGRDDDADGLGARFLRQNKAQ